MGFWNKLQAAKNGVRDYSKRKLMGKFYSEKMVKIEGKYNGVIEDVVKVCNERINDLGDPTKLSDEGLLINATGYNKMYESVKSIGGDEVKQLNINVQTLNKRLDYVKKLRKSRRESFPATFVTHDQPWEKLTEEKPAVEEETDELKENLLFDFNEKLKKLAELIRTFEKRDKNYVDREYNKLKQEFDTSFKTDVRIPKVLKEEFLVDLGILNKNLDNYFEDLEFEEDEDQTEELDPNVLSKIEEVQNRINVLRDNASITVADNQDYYRMLDLIKESEDYSDNLQNMTIPLEQKNALISEFNSVLDEVRENVRNSKLYNKLQREVEIKASVMYDINLFRDEYENEFLSGNFNRYDNMVTKSEALFTKLNQLVKDGILLRNESNQLFNQLQSYVTKYKSMRNEPSGYKGTKLDRNPEKPKINDPEFEKYVQNKIDVLRKLVNTQIKNGNDYNKLLEEYTKAKKLFREETQ